MWFDNVGAKPGARYPKCWGDQEHYRGGQALNRKRKLELKPGSRISEIALGRIFYNPDMPLIKDYYELQNYSYEHLTTAKSGKHPPVTRAYSEITGDSVEIEWGPNWEDDLVGGHITGPEDPNIQKIREDIKF